MAIPAVAAEGKQQNGRSVKDPRHKDSCSSLDRWFEGQVEAYQIVPHKEARGTGCDQDCIDPWEIADAQACPSHPERYIQDRRVDGQDVQQRGAPEVLKEREVEEQIRDGEDQDSEDDVCSALCWRRRPAKIVLYQAN